MSNLATNTRIIGIDCAADPRNIAVASAVGDGEELTVGEVFFGERGRDDSRTDRLKSLATRITDLIPTGVRTLLALDAPLGWPVALRRALAAEGTAGTAAGIPEEAREDANHMFRRCTDRFVALATGKTPQSVGASLVASVTHTALRLIDMIADDCGDRVSMTHTPLDDPDKFRENVHLIEVYPALAGPRFFADPSLGDWRAVAGKLKKFKKESDWNTVAKQLQECLQIVCDPLPHEVENDRRRLSDHGLDAILCAWTGQQFLQRKCVSPQRAEVEITDQDLEREGWIWFDAELLHWVAQREAMKAQNGT